MAVIRLRDRRSRGDRRAAAGRAGTGPTRRQIWTALFLYCAAFWGLVGYAIYDIFGG